MGLFDGRVAIVTGAASGFGAAMAEAFAAAGAGVIVADRDPSGAERTAGALSARGWKAAFCRADVREPDDAEAMVQTALRTFGRLDILVNNAGVLGPKGRLEDTSDVDFALTFDVNVKGVFLGCRAALPHFRRQRSGVIVNIASGSALRPRAGAVVYSASKGAVITLTRALALEAAGDGIRVNAICPAIARTPLAEKFVGEEAGEDTWDSLGRDLPLGRLVVPADVAQAAVWLASDSAAMVTGMCLPVDGGRCA